MPRKINRHALRQHWVHSHEEDTDREMVFRPATFAFPPSRGRSAFELKDDGTVVEREPGPTDRPQETEGTWKLEGSDRLAFFRPSQPTPTRVLRIRSVASDRLVVQKP